MRSVPISAATVVRAVGQWRGDGPTHRSLTDSLRRAILDGRLTIGARLPGERELAAAFGVSRTTVSRAIAELGDAGYVDGRERTAKRVTLPGRHAPDPSIGRLGWPVDDGRIDLAIAAPIGLSAAVHGAMTEALAALPRHLLGPGYHHHGVPELLDAVAHDATAHGARTDPSEVMVTSGALHAIALVLRAFAKPGDRVIVEQPTYPHAIDAVTRASLRPVPLPIADAWDLDLLERLIVRHRAPVAYLMPAFQNPTGRLMPQEQCRRLAAIAASTGCTIMVDETNARLALDGPAPPLTAVSGRAGRGSLIALGSASKVLWGGLRVGWIRAPRSVIAALGTARVSLDLGTSVIDQLAVAVLLRHGDVTAERIASLRSQRDHLARAVRNQLPTWTFDMPRGGVWLWAHLGGASSEQLVRSAAEVGVRLAAGSQFGVDGSLDGFLRLPFTQPVDVLDRAVDRLAAVASSTASPRRRTFPAGLVV
jgi:DNA-binding transcriptional MocR family regulator